MSDGAIRQPPLALARALLDALGMGAGDVFLHGDRATVHLWVAPAQASAAEPESKLERLILEVLREAGRPMMTSDILAALNHRTETGEDPHGESTVKGTLARMVRVGFLANDPRGQPRGYRLPEWAG
jgi:hypothetical protein